MFVEDLKEEIEKELLNHSELVDNGIGCYEFWGQRGLDKQLELEINIDKFTVDITSFYDDVEAISKGLRFDGIIAFSTENKVYNADYSVTLQSINKHDNKIIGNFTCK